MSKTNKVSDGNRPAPRILDAGASHQVERPLEYPRLRHFTMIEQDNQGPLIIVVGREHFELTEEIGSRQEFLALKRYFDGRHSVEEMSLITGTPQSDIRRIIGLFDEHGLLRQQENSDSIQKESFLAQVEATCDMWSRQIGYHRIFSMLRSGEAREEIFVGLLLETYHFVKAAARHIAIAISHCNEAEWEVLLTKYLLEEYDHAKLFVKTLEGLGIPKERVLDAHPIIGTMSLINLLCETARQNTLAYLVSISLFEGRREDFDDAKEDLELIGQKYGCDPEVLAPVIEHFRTDVQADHRNLLKEALQTRTIISASEAHFAVNCLHDLKHSFDQYHDQILLYYSDVSNYIPRPKVNYFSL